MKKMKCKHCGYEWQSRKARPVQCPSCKRYHWQQEKRATKTEVVLPAPVEV